MECTQESVLEFLLEKGGRVRNKELTEHFKEFLTGGKDRTVARETFKRFVDNIAYVKQENGEKMVCLKKKYREMKRRMRDADHDEGHAENNNLRMLSAVGGDADDAGGGDDAHDEKEEEEDKRMDVSDSEPVSDLCVSDISLIEVTSSDLAQEEQKGKDCGKCSGNAREACEDCALVSLDPLEHEWMMCASDGEWDSLQRLLDCEPSLVTKKDFVTGFTCLHWAAKQGKHELLAMLVTFAQQHSVAVNVNARSSAGYTPLHLAAMHNHIEVMKLLVGAYNADLEARDYSGKKPSQYLDPSVAKDIQDIVGACKDFDLGVENVEYSAGWWRLPKVLQSNLNPLRLLNPLEEPASDGQAKPKSLYRKASIGRIKLNRGKIRTQIVHSTSFRETEEGNRSLKSPVKSRPVSNLFG
uniref:Sosondowah ankyrin repeat domain family Ca n=1 Tax=Astyanax mexicanus TaxID=7994 RepID=A0A8B9KG19_ASTMX